MSLSLDDLYNLGQALVKVFNKDISKRAIIGSGYGQNKETETNECPSAQIFAVAVELSSACLNKLGEERDIDRRLLNTIA